MGQMVSDIEQVLNNKQARAEAKNARQKVVEEIRRTELEKTSLIKKALASQRAKFGAAGGGQSVSQDAVLARLRGEEAAPFDEQIRAAREKISTIKAPKINLLTTWMKRTLNP
ncbi:MAG: hypothetical protein LBL46_00650 [Rickettsiales bacterium]|nr:hypothetical protein [Rickettsiales bacterium]